jgi:hypothetical protein
MGVAAGVALLVGGMGLIGSLGIGSASGGVASAGGTAVNGTYSCTDLIGVLRGLSTSIKDENTAPPSVSQGTSYVAQPKVTVFLPAGLLQTVFDVTTGSKTIEVSAGTLRIVAKNFTPATQVDAPTNMPIEIPKNATTETNGAVVTITYVPTRWTASSALGKATLTPGNLALTIANGRGPMTCYPPGIVLTQHTTTPTLATVSGTSTEAAIDTLTVTTPSPLKLTTTSLTSGTVGAAYSATPTVSGGTAPYTWSATGLPTGLTINATSGKITGTPTKSGTSTVTITVTGATSSSVTKTLPLRVAPARSSGYDMVGSDGGVFVFPTGQAGGFYGSLPGLGVTVNNIVGMTPTPTGHGYFLVGSDGGVFAFGTAPFLGSLPGLHVSPTQPIIGVVAANTDRGYFLVGKDGGVFAFGTVPFLGSLPGIGVHRDDIIGIAATPSGAGYWLVASDGTVYGFGDAQPFGTARSIASPGSAFAGTSTGAGYWLTTQSGAVNGSGNAKHFGTLPLLGVSPALPVIGIVHTADTGGYWLIGADGGVFAFGDAGFVGSLPGVGVHVTDVVGAVPTT